MRSTFLLIFSSKILLRAAICSIAFLALAGSAFSETKEVHLVASGGGGYGPFDVDSGGRIERFIANMDGRTPGTLNLRAGFHVDSGVGVFEKLRLEVKKANQILFTSNCYSIHSPSAYSPKCSLQINITEAIADMDGNYSLTVTNNSGKRVKGFSIKKTGFDPLMPDFNSTFTNSCRAAVNLLLENAPITLEKGASVTRNLSVVTSKAGLFNIEAKWHTATLIPNVFVPLKVELLRPDGSVARSETRHSMHAPSSFQKLIIRYTSTAADAERPGRWRLRITNVSNEKIEGFDIRKGNDPNPFVPNLASTFKEECR